MTSKEKTHHCAFLWKLKDTLQCLYRHNPVTLKDTLLCRGLILSFYYWYCTLVVV